ncbi:unnamed protein product, partial [Staurois parvus]
TDHGKSRRCRLGHVLSFVQSQLITLIISAPSELPFSVTHQCQSVPPINANQCHLSVLPISATYQCQSVPPISACQCCLS